MTSPRKFESRWFNAAQPFDSLDSISLKPGFTSAKFDSLLDFFNKTKNVDNGFDNLCEINLDFRLNIDLAIIRQGKGRKLVIDAIYRAAEKSRVRGSRGFRFSLIQRPEFSGAGANSTRITAKIYYGDTIHNSPFVSCVDRQFSVSALVTQLNKELGL